MLMDSDNNRSRPENFRRWRINEEDFLDFQHTAQFYRKTPSRKIYWSALMYEISVAVQDENDFATCVLLLAKL
jgi:hypothetical protein